MHVRMLIGATALAAMTGTLSAQQGYQRRANLTGGGSAGGGQCVVEVMVDGAGEVEIRGDHATLRDLSGQAPQWRSFECTSAMPANPANFAFRRTEGRGTVELVRDPRNGGAAVVRIEDPESGAGVYRFNLVWNSGVGYQGGGYPGVQNNRGLAGRENNRQVDQGNGQWNDRNRSGNGYYRQYTQQDALRVCQDAVRQQAMQRFHTGNIQFRTTAETDGNRPDLVSGTLEIRNRDTARDDMYHFSCSVDYETGRVRNTQIDPMGRGQDRPGYGGNNGAANNTAIQSCQRAASQRVRRDGYEGIQFGAINVEDRPGGNDVVLGELTANGQYGPESFSFSCTVRLESGEVRSVDVTRR